MSQPNVADFFAIRDVICESELVLIHDPKGLEPNFRSSRIGRTVRHRIFGRHLLEVVCALPAGDTIIVPAAFVTPFGIPAAEGVVAITGASL